MCLEDSIISKGVDSNMRVIQTVPDVNNESSGPSYPVCGLCRGLYACRVNVELHIPAVKNIKDNAFSVYTYPRKCFFHFRGMEWSPALKKGLIECCQTADIIHSNGLWMIPNLYAAHAVRNTLCKLVTSPRGAMATWSLERSSLKKKIMGLIAQKKALAATDMFHATSEKEYEEIRAFGCKQPIAIVPIGMDIPRGKCSVDKNNEKRLRRIVFFGRIHKVKAIDNLVRAWGALHQNLPNWELVIAGPDCGAKQKLDEIVSELSIPRVRFTGELNGQAKYDFLADADIYVLPSHTENFGVTVAEALASGVPVIASHGTPWKGLESERCGRWIPIGVEPLVEALRDLISLSDDQRYEMGQRGIDWIRRDFSWEGIGAKMKVAYEWLLGRRDMPDWVKVD